MTVITGTAIAEKAFPRFLARRLDWDQSPPVVQVWQKHSAEHLDWSVDLYHVLNAFETVVGAWGEVSLDDQVKISRVGYAQKGVVVYVYGGYDRASYDLVITVATSMGRGLTFKAQITTYAPGDDTIIDVMPTFWPPVLGTIDDPAMNYLTDVLGVFLCPTWVDADGVLLVPDFGTDP